MQIVVLIVNEMKIAHHQLLELIMLLIPVIVVLIKQHEDESSVIDVTDPEVGVVLMMLIVRMFCLEASSR